MQYASFNCSIYFFITKMANCNIMAQTIIVYLLTRHCSKMSAGLPVNKNRFAGTNLASNHTPVQTYLDN